MGVTLLLIILLLGLRWLNEVVPKQGVMLHIGYHAPSAPGCLMFPSASHDWQLLPRLDHILPNVLLLHGGVWTWMLPFGCFPCLEVVNSPNLCSRHSIFHGIKNLVRCLAMVYICLSPSGLWVQEACVLPVAARLACHRWATVTYHMYVQLWFWRSLPSQGGNSLRGEWRPHGSLWKLFLGSGCQFLVLFFKYTEEVIATLCFLKQRYWDIIDIS